MPNKSHDNSALAGKKMKTLVTILLLVCTSLVVANPIVAFEHGTYYDAKKVTENCIIQADSESSSVSCEVTYTLKKAKSKEDSYYLHVALPIYLSSETKLNDDELMILLSPRIDSNGERFLPFTKPARVTRPEEREKHQVPEGADLIYYHFTIELGESIKNTEILVSYEQPTINGIFYYLPLFESGRSTKDHRIDILPRNTRITISPVEVEKDWEVLDSRITIHPNHNQRLEIKVAKSGSEGH